MAPPIDTPSAWQRNFIENVDPLSGDNLKLLHKVSQEVVWKHWMQTELTIDPNFRSDIRNPLPASIQWYLAEVESEDVDSMFTISSPGYWGDISGGTFRIKDVAERLNVPSAVPTTKLVGDDIRRKLDFLNNGGTLDTRLIAVTESAELSGKFTLIEGNRRAVAILIRNELVGCHIYVGVSPSMTEYHWARKAYGK